MNDKDKPANPFGRVERTIIRPNPGGRLPQAPAPIRRPSDAPARAVFADACHRQARPRYSPQPAGYAPAPASLAPEDWISTPATPLPPPLGRAGGTDAARRRTGGAQRQSDHARGRTAAAVARTPAGGVDARVVCKPDGAGRRRGKVLRERHPVGGNLRASGQHREIHSVRDRRRHRAAYSDRRPSRLGAVFDAEPLFRRAGRRCAVFRDSRSPQDRSAGQLSGSRTAACVPGARFPGHAPYRAERSCQPAGDSAQPLRNRCAGFARNPTPICRRTGTARNWPIVGSACGYRSGWSQRSSRRCSRELISRCGRCCRARRKMPPRWRWRCIPAIRSN